MLSISQKEIEEKNKALQEKDKLLKEASLAQDKHWQEERDRILERNKELEKDILRFASKEEDSQLEILRLKELLLEKEAVIAKQSKTISTMENYEARFNEIVKLHSRFKSTIVSNCKLRGLQDSDMGRSKYARSQQTL